MLNIEEIIKKDGLFDGRYKLIKTLNTDGGTADVWLAIDTNTIDNPDIIGEDDIKTIEDSGMLVAIKIYRPKNALDIEGEQRFRDEYKIVYNCRHTNLLQPTNFSIYKGTPYLELPYCKNGSSERLIGKKLSNDEIWKYIYDVSSGLAYLHSYKPPIIHQDIKPANVLIDDYNNYAITDFGISSQRGGKHGYYYDEENSGTMAYMAPERFKENYEPTAESDIWAFGATLYEILTGDVPFGEEGGKNQIINKQLKNNKHINSDVQKLIHSCLEINPQKRPTAKQIIRLSEKKLKHKNNKTRYILTIITVLTIAATVLYSYKVSYKNTPHKSTKETYTNALNLLNSNNPQTAQTGLRIMDSLSNKNYIPAMYELAKTYGWYSDSISLNRKKALGIEYYKEGPSKYMPISDKYNDKARELFSKIIESKDSVDPNIKANAAYRLATYSTNENNIYGQNFIKAEQYLLESKKYAIESNDSSLISIINTAIKRINDKIKKTNKNQ